MPGSAELFAGEMHRPLGNPEYNDGFQSIDRCETSDEKIEGGGEEGLHHCGGNWNVTV